MRIPWLAQEYERTCDDCGHVWRVPKWAERPSMKGLQMGRGGIAGPTAVVAGNAELAERAAVFRQCPECDSAHYKQRAIRF